MSKYEIPFLIKIKNYLVVSEIISIFATDNI